MRRGQVDVIERDRDRRWRGIGEAVGSAGLNVASPRHEQCRCSRRPEPRRVDRPRAVHTTWLLIDRLRAHGRDSRADRRIRTSTHRGFEQRCRSRYRPCVARTGFARYALRSPTIARRIVLTWDRRAAAVGKEVAARVRVSFTLTGRELICIRAGRVALRFRWFTRRERLARSRRARDHLECLCERGRLRCRPVVLGSVNAASRGSPRARGDTPVCRSVPS